MNLFELFFKIGAKDEASSAIEKIVGAAKGLAGTAASAISALAGAVTALGKQAIEAYADYEQLEGGVETLFGEAAPKVMDNAAQAFKTAGLSMNDYMETVTGFSASLIQSLGNDTELAAEVANRALVDMSDNANKMGTNMEAIQSAYSGFSKQNYTMLDNLKLGYGGTATEMQRLIADASQMTAEMDALGVSVDGTDMSFGNIVNAISVVQKHMGIAGTTALEASETISGSIGMLQGAWENVVIGIANDSADFDSLINDLIDSAGVVADNLLPRVEIAFEGIAKLAEKLLPPLIEKASGILADMAPTLIKTAATSFTSIVSSIADNLPTIVEAAKSLALELVNAVIENLPGLVDVVLSAVLSVISSLAEVLPELIPAVVDAILQIINVIINNIGLFVDAVISVVQGIVQGIIAAIPMIVEMIPTIVENLVGAIIDNIPVLVSGVLQAVFTLISYIVTHLPEILSAIAKVVVTLVKGIAQSFLTTSESATQSTVGQFFDKFKSFFKEKIPEFVSKVGEWFKQLPDKIKQFFDELPAKVGYALGLLIGKLISWAKEAINFVKTDVPKIISNIVDFFKELPGKVWTFLSDVAKKIPQMVTELINKARTEVPKFITKMVEFFKELPGKIKEVGTNLVKGLWEGIKNSADWIKNKVKEFANGVVSGIKDALGIHSPSRVMMGVGEMMTKGLENGFSDGIKVAGKSIVSDVENTVEEINKLSSTASIGATANFTSAENNTVSGTANPYSSVRDITLNVYGTAKQDVRELADIVMRELNKTVNMRKAVFE